MTDKEIVKRAKDAEKRTRFGELVYSPVSNGVNSAYGIGFIEGMVEYRNSLQEEPQVKKSAEFQHVNDTCKENGNSLTQEPVSKELEEAADNALSNVLNTHEIVNVRSCLEMFRFGAEWQFEKIKEVLLSEVLPYFMHGGEADEVVAKLDEVLNQKK